MPGTVKTVIAVYGTFMKGGPDYDHLLAFKATFIKNAIVKGYKMYDHRGDRLFPFILDGTPEDSVIVQIYRVGPKGLNNVALYHEDRLVGCHSGNPNDCPYIRKEVAAIDAEGNSIQVQIYVWNKELAESDVNIPSGDWMEYMGITPRAAAAGEEEPEPGEAEKALTPEDIIDQIYRVEPEALFTIIADEAWRNSDEDETSLGQDILNALSDEAEESIVEDILRALITKLKEDNDLND